MTNKKKIEIKNTLTSACLQKSPLHIRLGFIELETIIKECNLDYIVIPPCISKNPGETNLIKTNKFLEATFIIEGKKYSFKTNYLIEKDKISNTIFIQCLEYPEEFKLVNNRRHYRVDTFTTGEIPLFILRDEHLIEGKVLDLSLGGLKFHISSSKLRKDDTITIGFYFNINEEEVYVATSCQIKHLRQIRLTDKHIGGGQFFDIDKSIARLINEFIVQQRLTLDKKASGLIDTLPKTALDPDNKERIKKRLLGIIKKYINTKNAPGEKYFSKNKIDPDDKRRKIVIVDANQKDTNELKELLYNHFEIITESDEVLGLKRILSEKPDLVVIALGLKGKNNGITLCEKIKKDPKIKDIPLFLISDSADKQTVMSAFSIGIRHFIIQPYSPDDVSKRIKEVLKDKKKTS